MSNNRLGDRTTLGIWALQDHQQSLGVADRHYLVGARLVDPGPADDAWFHAFDEQRGKPVVGDIHPWRWWEASTRDHGAFTQAMVCRVTGAGESNFDAQGRQITGGGAGTADLKPVRTRGYAADDAFADASHTLPSWWPRAPKGFVMLGAAGTHEGRQEDILGWLDPRMVAADRNGHNLMGSRIIDLDPENTASTKRSALLQTHARVAHVMAIRTLDVEAGWSAAWHLSRTRQGDEAGLGSVYGELDSRRAQTTPGERNPGGAITVTEGTNPSSASDRANAETIANGGYVRDDRIPNDGRNEGVSGTDAGGGGRRGRRGKSGIALASRTAWGPLHLGHEEDQHKFGLNDDGEPVNSLHLDPDRAMWFRRQDRDAPLEFDTIEYGPSRAPMRVRAWIRYDTLSVHGWNGETRPGLWRLEAESFFGQKRPPGDGPPTTTPDDPGPPTNGGPPVTEPPRPVEPTDTPGPTPDPGAPGGPTPVPAPPSGPSAPPAPVPWPSGVPRPDRPGSGFPTPSPWGPGVSPPVGPPRGPLPPSFGRWTNATWKPIAQQDRGTVDPESVAYSAMQLGFPGALVFPQHVGAGAADLRYAGSPRAEDQARAMAQTPAVVRFGSWGYQSGNEWTYTTKPGYSRVPGGTASGGMLVLSPEVDEADYGDSYAPTGVTSSTTYFGWGKGTYAAWGVGDPTTGDLGNGSYRAGYSGTSLIHQTRISGTWTDVLGLGATGQTTFYGSAVARVALYLLEQGSAPATAASTPAIYSEAGSRLRVKWPGGGTSTLAHESPVEAFTSDDTLTAAESGKTCHNTGAGGVVTLTLPAAANGLAFRFVLGAAAQLIIQTNGTDTIEINASSSAAGGTAHANAIGRVLQLLAIGSIWYATEQIGSWTLT